MLEKEKLQEIEKNLESKKTELKEAKTERKKADTPEKMVNLDKKIADLENIIERIENTKKALSYMPPAESDVANYLKVLDKYYSAKNDKVKEITNTYNQTLAKISECEQLIQNAQNNYNFDEAVEQAKKRDDFKAQLEYIKEMKAKSENIPVFQQGDLENEWRQICEGVRKDLETTLERVELLATEYKLAVKQFETFYQTLLDTRNKMGNIAMENGVYFVPEVILTNFKALDYDYFNKYGIERMYAKAISRLLSRSPIMDEKSV